MSTAMLPESKATRPFRGKHHQHLTDLRDSARRKRISTGFVAVLAFLIVGVATIAGLDFLLELPIIARSIALLMVVAGTTLIIFRWRRWLRFEATDAAATAEQAWPELGQRIRTSHDYADASDVAPADLQLVAALERETDGKTRGREFEPLAPAWPLWTALATCGGLIVAWFLMLIIVPESQISTARAMLIPANYTDVVLHPVPQRIAQGDDLEIRADVNGRPLESAQILFRPAGSGDDTAWSELDLAPRGSGPLHGTLVAVIPDCRDDIELRVEAGPEEHPVHRVIVQAPLVLEEWTARVQPPAYTKLPTDEGAAERLRVPEGSRVELAARYNRAPDVVDPEFRFTEVMPVWQQQLEDVLLHGTLKNLQQSLELRLQARAADGMTDESYPLRIRVIPDEAPLVRFTSPEENAEAIPTQEIRFSIDAGDDYGISRVGIIYKIGNGLEQTLWEAAPQESPAEFRQTTVLALEDLNLTFNDAISYYAFVEDNREPEPQLTLSELRFLDIRPFSREYQFQEGNCNCQGECLSLEKLIAEQRAILQRTFSAMQRDTPGQGPDLADQEQSLQEKTASLAQALASSEVGPVAPLENAVDAMELATAALDADNIPSGLGFEEAALADLIEARQNLRRILNQGNSQSQAAQSVDQRELQRLRPPEREPQQQEQEQERLARLRREMEQLARQQRSFCQSAAQCASSSSSQNAAASRSEQTSETGELPVSREELVRQQQEAAEAARQLQQQLANGDFGDLAPERMQQAAESISHSGDALAGERDEESIGSAEQAAEELERLSHHLAQRHAPDFGDRLDHAQRHAAQLAGEQRALSESIAGNDEQSRSSTGAGPADPTSPELQQQSLVERGEELADLVGQLEQDATAQDWTVQRRLADAVASHPPEDAADTMRAAASELAAGRSDRASRSGLEAAEDLDGLAAGLRDVQDGLGQAELEQLLAAEERAAELLRELERTNNSGEQSLARARAAEFAESLRTLARGDEQLSRSLQQLQDLTAPDNGSPFGAAQPDGVSDDERPDDNLPEGRFGESPRTPFAGLRIVDQVLQRRIQEAILSGSLQQTDESVPPEYTQMVEDYYRTLSEDIE